MTYDKRPCVEEFIMFLILVFYYDNLCAILSYTSTSDLVNLKSVLIFFSQLPFLCGLPFLERGASQAAHFIVGRSGKHLFLTDDDGGRPPLLLRMVHDSEDLKFVLVLVCL